MLHGKVGLICSFSEPSAVPFQRFLRVFPFTLPLYFSDVLPCARQGVEGIQIIHFKAWWITIDHTLCGIGVATECEAAGFGADRSAVFGVKRCQVVESKQLVLTVGFVPVAHFHLDYIRVKNPFIE